MWRLGVYPLAETSPSGRPYCLSGYHSSIVGECLCSSHLRALEGIKDELQILSERCSAAGYKENEADGHAISELAEDLRDAVLEYQVGPGHPATRRMFLSPAVQFTQQKSLYEQNCRLIVRPGHV